MKSPFLTVETIDIPTGLPLEVLRVTWNGSGCDVSGREDVIRSWNETFAFDRMTTMEQFLDFFVEAKRRSMNGRTQVTLHEGTTIESAEQDDV